MLKCRISDVVWSTKAVQCVLYLPLTSCDFLGISLAKNCNIFNFDEVLVSSLTPLHPPRFVANGFHDDGTKSHFEFSISWLFFYN